MNEFSELAQAHRGYLRTFRATFASQDDPDTIFRLARPAIENILNTRASLRLRILICVKICFQKIVNDDEEKKEGFYFCSNCERILSSTQINETVDKCFIKILKLIDTFVRNGSGWNIKEINYIDLHVGDYRENSGGCKNATLPEILKRKKALLNITCEDNFCFLYSIAASVFPKSTRSPHKAYLYKKDVTRFKLGSIKFPLALSDIQVFENLNDIAVNVYGYEEKEIYPLQLSKKCNSRKTVDLLFFDNHFFTIRNFNRLLHTKNLGFFCKMCLTGFQRLRTLEYHETLCNRNKPQKVSIPKNMSLKFSNLSRMLYHPYCAFADFECLTRKIQTAFPSPGQSHTTAIEQHVPVSYTLLVIDVKDTIVFHEYFCGENVMEHFFTTLGEIRSKILRKMKACLPLTETSTEHYNDNVCHICRKSFVKGDIRVRDHCHWGDGHMRGLAHQSCNLNYKITYFIPVVIHNFRNYDSHLLLKHMPEKYAKSINIIPVNMEKFSMFSLDEIKFIDSFQFLDASLETLVTNLKKSDHEFKLFNSFFINETQRELLLRKGIFPYSYFDSISVLEETSLPPQSAFYNTLQEEAVSDEDYAHANLVFNSFGCKTFADYLELYQNTDVVLLAEVFLSFRRTAHKYYQLDPAHFITAAELTWNAGLKVTKIELQLLGDVNQYIWFESQMRGGICFLGRRHAVANNPYIPDSYNPDLPHSHILALDANNLYGCVMSQFLPIGGFNWLTKNEVEAFNILTCVEDSDIGYIIECDLLYPQHLHDQHNDLPLAPEHFNITFDMLSPYAKTLHEKFQLTSSIPCKKLLPNFYEKKNYIAHYLNLKFYVEQGLIIKKIHRILAFTQRPWLKEYIAFNNEKRQSANSEFEKSFFKKMNNAFYGKCSQDVRKNITVHGVFTKNQCEKKLNSPLLEYFEIVNENFSIFKMKKANLLLDKPIYVGFSVLELSKLHMYKLFYSHFKETYKEKCELLYMDTDSLYLYIQTEDIYRDLKDKFENILDCSNFERNHIMYSEENRGKLGFLKSETLMPICEFIGLKCKMYAFRFGNTVKKTAKGVKKSALKNIGFDTYKKVLENASLIRNSQYSIISNKHNLKTIFQNKISLSAFYDKKYLLEDGINSFSYGHYNASNESEIN